MKHRITINKFSGGIDADRMLMRKLLINYLKHPNIVTTEKKAKALKSLVDIVVGKARVQSEANRNYIRRYVTDSEAIEILFNQIGPAVKDIVGGYVKTTRLNRRTNDGAMMVRIEWAHPIVTEWKSTEKKIKSKKVSDKTEEIDNKKGLVPKLDKVSKKKIESSEKKVEKSQ